MACSAWHGSMLMAIDTVLFDLDGTLVDSAPLIGTILNEMRTELGCPPLPANCFRQWISLGAAELVSRSLAVPLPDVAPWLQEFRGRYAAMPTPGECLFPGVLATVAALAGARVRLGICSNKPAHLCRKVLAETGLLGYFGTIVGGDTVPWPKPHRQPLDHAIKLLGTQSEWTIFVGDSTVDQRAAASAGVPFVFFAAGYNDGVDLDSVWARVETLPQTLALVRSELGNAAPDDL